MSSVSPFVVSNGSCDLGGVGAEILLIDHAIGPTMKVVMPVSAYLTGVANIAKPLVSFPRADAAPMEALADSRMRIPSATRRLPRKPRTTLPVPVFRPTISQPG